jgi:D-alanine--D-alanine ligase
MKIGIICGGPSLERGISLNSARSLLDHLESDSIELVPFYLDHKKQAYAISTAQLYSNTPSDFDFKLEEAATALNQKQFVQALKKVDLVFPVMHGTYGEDGGIQRFLEKHKIPFVGASSAACGRAFDKFNANEYIGAEGFYTLPSAVLKIYHDDHAQIIQDFFKKHGLKRAIVKPASGGSSIGVFSVNSPEEALVKVQELFSRRMDTRVVIEQFAEGIEFTVIILQNRFGQPVAILPTEIETDYTANQIFDYRKKYLPTRQVTYHCPPRFSNEIIEKIQIQAEQLFSLFQMQDFARFDGWLLANGELWFSDFNPISGMEQNSFLFQQASRVGLSHHDVLRHIVGHALTRYGRKLPPQVERTTANQKKISVIFGGKTAERQVSLMSGTNVWLKLRGSKRYAPTPFLLDLDGEHVWKLPYPLTLNHTVEEIIYNCAHAPLHAARLALLEAKVRLRLGLPETYSEADFGLPQKMTLQAFIETAPFIFIGLHGGIGEDGTLQKMLKNKNIGYNGPDEATCRLCMDKAATKQFLAEKALPGVLPIQGKALQLAPLLTQPPKVLAQCFQDLLAEFKVKSLIFKPSSEGCSSGVVHLYSGADFASYIAAFAQGVRDIPAGTLKNQKEAIEMPLQCPDALLAEEFIETDRIRIKGNVLKYQQLTGWVEMTVGVIEAQGKLHVLTPSITVAEGEVLSLEEKFQGGTGINLTPPPTSLIDSKTLAQSQTYVKSVAAAIGLTGYCRMDIFVELKSGQIKVIEVNTLPGLTPSTVLYHQALAEHSSIYPRAFLESLVSTKQY